MTKPLGKVAVFLGQIAVADEPNTMSLTWFVTKGDGLLAFEFAPPASLSQVIIGLSANQMATLLDRLREIEPHIVAAIAGGKGGAEFTNNDAPEAGDKAP